MYHLHLTRNLRSLAFVLVALAIVAALGTLWWANQTGLPDVWRATIEQAISKQGAHVKIAAIRYVPLQGVIASDVRVFSDPAHRQEISRLEHVILDIDKTKLATGEIQLKRIELKDARLILPVSPDDPDTEVLVVTGAYGTLLMPGDRRFEIRNAKGRIAGINVRLNARIIGYKQDEGGSSSGSPTGRHRKLLAKIVSELNKWRFDPDSPPLITAFLEGDLNDPESLTADLALHAESLEKNSHRLEQVKADATVIGNLLSVTSMNARDGRGVMTGSVDYNLKSRKGRFDLHSSLDILRLLKAWAGMPQLQGVVTGGKQTLDAEGEFMLRNGKAPQVHLTGRLQCDSVILRGMQFDSVETAFAWKDNSLFLKDALLSRPDGYAKGKAMIQLPMVRLAVESTLPPSVIIPLFRGKPLEKVLADFTPRKDAAVLVTLEGGFDTTERTSWVYSGHGKVTNYNYRGVPVFSADCGLDLSHGALDFTNGTVVFDYTNYALRKAYKGPRQGIAKVGAIRYDGRNKIVHVDNVTGDFWAAPMVRFFAPKVADNLERYRFHRPPALNGSGVVDVTPQGRTALNISFKSKSAANYQFLGKDVTVDKPVGKVAILNKRILVEDLAFNAFDAPVDARIDVLGTGVVEGEAAWSKLSTRALATTYELSMKTGGYTTGRMDFSIRDGKVETMAGRGHLALEETELLSVPMFGPLSPLISGVLNNRKAGFERADSAFCNFNIDKGIVSTRDFRTSTTSLTFVGDGSVNLKDRTLDMTMRMNARGLLGFITLPLRPLYGMFQFHGSGPLSAPDWKKVLFAAPSAKQAELLEPAPKAKIIPEPQ